jgi:hypothetical protein
MNVYSVHAQRHVSFVLYEDLQLSGTGQPDRNGARMLRMPQRARQAAAKLAAQPLIHTTIAAPA